MPAFRKSILTISPISSSETCDSNSDQTTFTEIVQVIAKFEEIAADGADGRPSTP
jgi:hypothetical protein